jgi:diacylglycerol O-acyltransferase / wax synthase
MSISRSQRLTSHDTVFLHWERPEQPMHVAEIMVYDGRITAADMVAMLTERMHLLPRYRQKVVPAPFGVAHPTWEDDPHFDLHNHVAERTLPAPGDNRVLSRTCGELFCELLPRDRPMWHLTVLGGYTGGGTVIFLKLHHSMVDGVSSVELIDLLHSTKRGAAPPPAPAAPWQPRPVPGVIDRLRGVVADQAGMALEIGGEMVDLIRPGAVRTLAERSASIARATADLGSLAARRLSPTPFNERIHPSRDVAWVELPIAETRVVRKKLGGTVNDLVLAILSGAIGRYMRRHGYATDDRVLKALCPVSVRGRDQSGAMGNLISMVVAPLYVGIDDGGERFAAERESMQELKRRGQADGIHELIAATKWYPAPVFRLLWKTWPSGYFPMHITSTNVPGPRQPLFMGEHELLHWYPFGVQWTNNALFLCTLSYREHLILGPVADPEVVPDVWEFGDDLRAAYDELRIAAGVTQVDLPDTREFPEAGSKTNGGNGSARRAPSKTTSPEVR